MPFIRLSQLLPNFEKPQEKAVFLRMVKQAVRDGQLEGTYFKSMFSVTGAELPAGKSTRRHQDLLFEQGAALDAWIAQAKVQLTQAAAEQERRRQSERKGRMLILENTPDLWQWIGETDAALHPQRRPALDWATRPPGRAIKLSELLPYLDDHDGYRPVLRKLTRAIETNELRAIYPTETFMTEPGVTRQEVVIETTSTFAAWLDTVNVHANFRLARARLSSFSGIREADVRRLFGGQYHLKDSFRLRIEEGLARGVLKEYTRPELERCAHSDPAGAQGSETPG